MTLIRIPSWGLTVIPARYYGYRWAAQIGPWIVFFGSIKS